MVEPGTVEELVYAGWPAGTLVAAGVAIAALVAVLAWRERRAMQVRLVPALAVVRLLVVILVLWLLAEPVIRTTTESRRSPSVAMLLDHSASMATADEIPGWSRDSASPSSGGLLGSPENAQGSIGASGLSRMERATDVLMEAERSSLHDVERRARVCRYEFSGQVKPVDARQWDRLKQDVQREENSSTDLASALQQIARDSAAQNIAAAFVLTDGGHNGRDDPLKAAAALARLPVYVVPFGNPNPLRDVLLHHVNGPRAVFEGDSIVIEAMLDAYHCAGEDVVVDLLDRGRVLATQRIIVPADTYTRRLTFTRKAESLGRQDFQVRVQPLPEETTDDNNEGALAVEVTEGRIRVLLADGCPRWEFRYLRNLFKRDEQMEYAYLQMSPFDAAASKGPPPQGLPGDVAGWNRYRVVILGDVGPESLSHKRQTDLAEYVERHGGTLILLAGDDNMPRRFESGPLGRLLPVVEHPAVSAARDAAYPLTLSSEGAAMPITQFADDRMASERIWRECFNGHLAVRGLSPFARPKPTAHVLIRADAHGGQERTDAGAGPAFLCWQQVGSGRVIYLAAPTTYYLRHKYGDAFHHRFWGQLLRWAVARELGTGTEHVTLATDKDHYLDGDEVLVTMRARRPNGDPVTVTDARVAARRDEQAIASAPLTPDPEMPGVHRVVLSGLPAGQIEIELQSMQVQALLAAESHSGPLKTAIVVEPPETLEMRDTRCNLPLLTEIAKVTGGRVVQPDELAETVSELDLKEEVSRTVTQRPLWNRWAYLWLIAGCLSVEWVVRKWSGLT